MYPLLWVSGAFIGGILLARTTVHIGTGWWLFLGLFTLFLAFAGIRVSRAKNWQPFGLSARTQWTIGLSCLTFFLGGARYQSNLPEINSFHIAWYNERAYDVLVTGTLAAPPDYRDTYTNLTLQVEGIDTGNGFDLPISGLLLARIFPGETYHYGDHLRLRGKLQTPPENETFSYKDYLARYRVFSIMRSARITRLPDSQNKNFLLSATYTFKEHTLQKIYSLFPDPEASLLAGILLGVETGIPSNLQQAFKDTGTAHIIAISGFNIAIIAALFMRLFSRLAGKRRGAILTVGAIAFYTFLVGADASVVRAAIMGTMGLFAREVGRRQFALNTLGIVAAIMAVFNPLVLWDVGFQLSFGATLGLILYSEPMQNAAFVLLNRHLPESAAKNATKLLAEYVLLTLAAQLTTLPIMAYHFGRVSLVSLIANPFILPAQPPVMILGGLALLLSFIWHPLGQIVAYAAWPFPLYTIRLVELFDKIPHGAFSIGTVPLFGVIVFYIVLFATTLQGQLMSKIRAFLSPVAVLSTLGIVTLLFWRSALAAPTGQMQITFLDVGSGDAILIQTPTGHNVLINGGTSPSALSNALGRRLPPFKRQLDWLVVASTQENQVSALPRVLERFPPQNALWAGNLQASFSAREVSAFLASQSIPTTTAKTGQTLDLRNDATLTVLASDNRGAVLLLEWENFRALLPVGMSFDSLAALKTGSAVGSISALLLAESGYAPLNPPEWISSLRPKVVILSVSASDINGMPDRETLQTLQGYNLFRTDRNGWIRLRSDGEQMWIEVEKAD